MEERRKQGLCYNCDEKWQVGHKCKGAKLFLLEGVNEIEPKTSRIQLVEITEEEVLMEHPQFFGCCCVTCAAFALGYLSDIIG